MKTNREWLNNLAATDPNALQAWFDAEHVDAQRDINGTCPISNGTASDDAHSKMEPLLTEQSELLSDEALQERIAELQAQVDELEGKYEASSRANEILTREKAQVKTENAKLQAQVDELTQKLDNISHDLAESERLREEMREELSVAYDHAHDLLARRDRGLA